MSEETATTDQQLVVPAATTQAKGNLVVEYLPLRELIPYARNARTHNEAQVRQIAGSIAEYGFTNAILIDPANGIIAGHGRALAAEILKLDTVPCIRLGWLTDAQKRAYMLADNRIALNSGWDPDMLAIEIRDLMASDVNLGGLGFDEAELAALKVADPWAGGQEQPPKNNQASDGGAVDGQLHRILLVYEPDEYHKILEKAQAVMQRDALPDMSRLFANMLEKYADAPSQG